MPESRTTSRPLHILVPEAQLAAWHQLHADTYAQHRLSWSAWVREAIDIGAQHVVRDEIERTKKGQKP